MLLEALLRLTKAHGETLIRIPRRAPRRTLKLSRESNEEASVETRGRKCWILQWKKTGFIE